MKLKKLLSYFKPKPREKDAALILFFLAFISLAGFNIYDGYITGNAVKEMKETKENYTSIPLLDMKHASILKMPCLITTKAIIQGVISIFMSLIRK